MLLLTAFLAALSFSVLSRLGWLFCRPACFLLCAVRRSSRRLFCRPTSTSGAFVSAGLRPPFLGLLVPDRSLPWPPCAWVASLAALCAAFLAARHASSLAALWASSLAARCAACLAARRAGSLAAQCAAYFAARRAAYFAARRAAYFAARCAAYFAARCTACFAARCTACFAARCTACFAARCTACFAARCAACFAAQCDAYFTACGVACLAAPCAASLAASRAAFLDAPYVGSFPVRPVASLAAQAGPPSTSVVSCLRLPFRGAPFSAPFSAWSLPLATSLHRFFHFSNFVPVSPSCSSLILGPSHIWPYRHGDTGTACTSTALWDLSAIGNEAICHHRLTKVPSVYMLIEA